MDAAAAAVAWRWWCCLPWSIVIVLVVDGWPPARPGVEMSRTKQQPMDTRGIWCRNKQEAENDDEGAKSNKFLILRQKFHFSSKTLIILLCVNRTLSWRVSSSTSVVLMWLLISFVFVRVMKDRLSSTFWVVHTNCVPPHSAALGFSDHLELSGYGINFPQYCCIKETPRMTIQVELCYYCIYAIVYEPYMYSIWAYML